MAEQKAAIMWNRAEREKENEKQRQKKMPWTNSYKIVSHEDRRRVAEFGDEGRRR